MKTIQNDVIQKATAEFDEQNGKGSHEKYNVSITQDSEKWNVHFDPKEIALPGDNHVVFVYKNGTKVEYMAGE